jgi:hypothetical protein
MVAISLCDFERDFPAYLRRVEAGEFFVIVDHNRPVAEINPPCLVGGEFRITLADYLTSRINDARIPQRWCDEGVAEPTDDCRRVSLMLAERLFHTHGLLPVKVVASRQEGIYLSYKAPFRGCTLGIEIDNELDAVAVVADAHGTLASAPFEGEDADRLLRLFFTGPETPAGNSRSPDA